MSMDMDELNKRFIEAKAYKDRWLALYNQLYDYVIPNRHAFNEKFNYDDQGRPLTQMMWDDTAIIAGYQRANDLHGLLMPKDRIWGQYQPDPRLVPQQLIAQTKLQIDDMNDRIHFYMNRSNLARVVSSSNLDLLGGTGVIWVESHSDDVPLYFRSVPAVTTYMEYSSDDILNNAWFGQKMTGYTILKDFPKYKGKQLKTIQANPQQTYIVNYGQIQLREDSYYIYAFLDVDTDYPLMEAERPYKQLIIYRDRVRPGETEGRGIGLDMLPTIIDLNHMCRDRRFNYALKGRPPLFYDSVDYINPYAIRQWAGAMIPRTPGGRNPIEAMTMPEYPSVIEEIQDLRQQIMKAFQVDPLGEIDQPVKTATEVSIRENRAQRTSATDISRLINEQSMQIMDTCARILNSRNMLFANRKQVPFNTKKLTFNFMSPLYDLQNQSDVNHFVSNMQIKQQFMGEGVALGTLDIGEANDFLNTKLNLPTKLFKDKESLSKFLTAMSEQAQQPQPLPQPATTGSPVALPPPAQEVI